MKNKIPKFLKQTEIAKRKLSKAKRKRIEKKITDKIGFEYKDRKKVW